MVLQLVEMEIAEQDKGERARGLGGAGGRQRARRLSGGEGGGQELAAVQARVHGYFSTQTRIDARPVASVP